MKVFFVGHFGAKNLGDELLLQTQIDVFEKSFKEKLHSYVYSYNIDTDYYNDYPYIVTQVVGFSFKRFFQSIQSIIKTVREVDILVVGGGGIIQDKYFVYRPLSTLLPAFIAFLFNKPVYGFSLGIYKMNLNLNKKLVRQFLHQANFITYRDDASEDNISELLNNQVKESIKFLPDSALALSYMNDNVTIEKEKYILVAIREVFDEYIDELKSIIIEAKLQKNATCVKLVTFENTEDDIKVLKKLTKLLEAEKVLVEVLCFPSVKEYLKLVDEASKVIAGRLHACIPAYVLKTDVIGLAYEEKVSDFCKSHGLEYAYIDNLKEKIDSKLELQGSQEKDQVYNYVEYIKNDYKKAIKVAPLRKIKFILFLIYIAIINFIIHVLQLNYRKEG